MSEYSKKRIDGLDFVRSVAILMVMVSHCRYVFDQPNDELSFFGFFGVELFFVLSGYLIGTILIKNLADQQGLQHFWFRRWTRTLPLYLVAITFLFYTSGTFPAEYLVFGQGFTNNWNLMPVSWSLCVEEFFYLFLPIIVVSLRRFYGLKKWFNVKSGAQVNSI